MHACIHTYLHTYIQHTRGRERLEALSLSRPTELAAYHQVTKPKLLTNSTYHGHDKTWERNVTVENGLEIIHFRVNFIAG